jgi:hypothetical protein
MSWDIMQYAFSVTRIKGSLTIISKMYLKTSRKRLESVFSSEGLPPSDKRSLTLLHERPLVTLEGSKNTIDQSHWKT